VDIDPQYLQIFDEPSNAFKLLPGQYTFAVGGSSQDLGLKQEVALK
jgi:beta-glucosidase